MTKPIVIAHRGASGERPEHTRSAYELAIAQGCDFVEPDLVMSKDGVLIVRHENEIGETTDVAEHPAFASRRTYKVIDGKQIAGWFAEDFTFDELKTLRCRERLPALRPQNTRYDGQDPILAFEELIELARDGGAQRGRAVGLYVEMKHPTYFASIGLPVERALADILRAHGLDGEDAPVFVECFEPTAVKAMRDLVGSRLGQLIAADGAPFDAVVRGEALTYAEMTTARGLKIIAEYAHAVGPDKALIGVQPALIADAHTAALRVHPWTFRAENALLPSAFQRGDPADANFDAAHGDVESELAQALARGVDGVFCDYPAIARKVIDAAPT